MTPSLENFSNLLIKHILVKSNLSHYTVVDSISHSVNVMQVEIQGLKQGHKQHCQSKIQREEVGGNWLHVCFTANWKLKCACRVHEIYERLHVSKPQS